MNSDLGSCLRLARGLLRLYGLAVASKHRGVADHLQAFAIEHRGRRVGGAEIEPRVDRRLRHRAEDSAAPGGRLDYRSATAARGRGAPTSLGTCSAAMTPRRSV